MESKISQALGLKYEPVAILWTDERPEAAMEFSKGKWGCVMWHFANAAKGKVAVFSKETYGCCGGGVGLGFGNAYLEFPGGLECFYNFISIGNKGSELGRKIAEGMKSAGLKEFVDDYLEGERYQKTPGHVKEFVDQLPMMEVPTRYVVFKPLKMVDPEKERPRVVVFLADPNQVSALTILANYGRDCFENVIVPWAAGCMQIGILAYRECKSNPQRAVLGLTDISARLNTKPMLGTSYMTFAVPFEMFLEMEGNVEGSFLERPTWRKLTG